MTKNTPKMSQKLVKNWSKIGQKLGKNRISEMAQNPRNETKKVVLRRKNHFFNFSPESTFTLFVHFFSFFEKSAFSAIRPEISPRTSGSGSTPRFRRLREFAHFWPSEISLFFFVRHWSRASENQHFLQTKIAAGPTPKIEKRNPVSHTQNPQFSGNPSPPTFQISANPGHTTFSILCKSEPPIFSKKCAHKRQKFLFSTPRPRKCRQPCRFF